MIVFIDTEFTDLLNPELLSIGLVTLDGREHYVELDITGELSAEACFRELNNRGLQRHHALADALALRAAYIDVKAEALVQKGAGQ